MLVTDLFEKFDRYQPHDLRNPLDPEVTKIKDVDHLIDIIEANCKTMLAAYRKTGKVLYRGLKGVSSPTYIVTGIRPDRMPVEMDKHAHALLHDAYLNLGLKATRTNSIFCSASETTAQDWGNVFVVFVKDGWEGTVFDDVKDDYSFYQVSRWANQAAYDLSNKRNRREVMDGLVSQIKTLEPKKIKSTSDLVYVLKNNFRDVLITGDSFIGVRAEAFDDSIGELLGIKK